MENYDERIKFLEKSSETKERIVKSENDRIQLEIELNKLLNSDAAV
jgi:DNA polymerase III delta prime subunit